MRRIPTITVRADNSDTRVQRALKRDVEEGLAGSTWVGKVDVGHLQDGLILGLDTIQETWFRELEGEGGSRKFVVYSSKQVGKSLQDLASGRCSTNLERLPLYIFNLRFS